MDPGPLFHGLQLLTPGLQQGGQITGQRESDGRVKHPTLLHRRSHHFDSPRHRIGNRDFILIHAAPTHKVPHCGPHVRDREADAERKREIRGRKREKEGGREIERG
jgi:hypothetical protein